MLMCKTSSQSVLYSEMITIICFLLTIISIRCVCSTSRSGELVIKRGQRIPDYVVASVASLSILDCNTICVETPGCLSVNFNPSTRDCEVCNESPLKPGITIETNSAWNNFHKQAVNGGWSAYSGWNTCSKTCGTGTRTRTRSCDSPAPENYGAACLGSNVDQQSCNTQLCPASCDTPWSYYDNSCYLVENSRNTWDATALFCSNLGAAMVEISSAAENSFVASIAAGKRFVWLGLNKVTDGSFVWPSGATTNYLNLGDGEGYMYADEKCFAMETSAGTWSDLLCSRTEYTMCEKPAG